MSTQLDREALAEALFEVYDHGTQPNALKEADAVIRILSTQAGEEESDADFEPVVHINGFGEKRYQPSLPNGNERYEYMFFYIWSRGNGHRLAPNLKRTRESAIRVAKRAYKNQWRVIREEA